MPISGLTDRKTTQVDLRLRSIGKIRKGIKEGRDLIDLEFFRFVPEPGFAGIEKAFWKVYGAEPRLLFGYLPFKTVELNWSTWHEAWGEKAGLIHRCDGVHMVQWLNENKEYIRDYELKIKRPCPYGPQAERPASGRPCKGVGRLSLILPDLMKELLQNGDEYGLQVAPLGLVTLITTSTHDLGNLSRELFSLEQQGGTDGLTMMPVVVRRILEEIGTRFEGKNGEQIKTKSKKWMIHVFTTTRYVLNQIAATENLRQLEARTGGVSPSPSVLDEEVLEGEYLATPGLDNNPWNGEAGGENEPTVKSQKPEPSAKKNDKSKKKPLKANGERPYSADMIKDKILTGVAQKSQAQQTTKATTSQRGLLNGKLEEALGIQDQEAAQEARIKVLSFLFPGLQSSSDLKMAQASCCLDWLLDPQRDEGAFDLHPCVSAEVGKILYVMNVNGGQAELGL